MSGHSKWSTIKHKKARLDAKRGRIFSRISKEITSAARSGGGDQAMNAALRSAVLSAKIANMPSDNVDRAIKKGTGELGGAALEEVTYEGYAPGGVAILMEILTDNRNRIAADIRMILSRNSGSLASTGAVAWQFHRKSRFVIEGDHADEDKLTELLLEADVDVEDVSGGEGVVQILAAPDAFGEVFAVLEKNGIPASEAGLVQIPENTTPVSDAAVARQIQRLVEALEDYDDVQHVYSNEQFDDAVMAELNAD